MRHHHEEGDANARAKDDHRAEDVEIFENEIRHPAPLRRRPSTHGDLEVPRLQTPVIAPTSDISQQRFHRTESAHAFPRPPLRRAQVPDRRETPHEIGTCAMDLIEPLALMLHC
jgi:hypothetical protein